MGYLPTWGSVSHKDVWNKGLSALLGRVPQMGILRNEDPYEGDFLCLLFPFPLVGPFFYWRKNSSYYFSDINVTVYLVCILLVFCSSQCCIFETNCIPLATLSWRVLDWCVCSYQFYPHFWCDPDYVSIFFLSFCARVLFISLPNWLRRFILSW